MADYDLESVTVTALREIAQAIVDMDMVGLDRLKHMSQPEFERIPEIITLRRLFRERIKLPSKIRDGDVFGKAVESVCTIAAMAIFESMVTQFLVTRAEAKRR